MRKTFTLLFFTYSFALMAQEVTTLNVSWKTSEVTQLATGEKSTEPQKLVVYKTDNIEWQDAKGVKKYRLTIESNSGKLFTDGQGEIVYKVTGQNVMGNITIRKTQTQSTIKVILVQNNKPAMYEMIISGYDVL